MRYPDWQKRFWEEIARQYSERFVWGVRDCVLAAARTADAISDGRYVKRARDLYSWSSEHEADQVLSARNLSDLVQTILGPMVKWTMLGMGDIALIIDDEKRQSLGIHDGAQVLGPASRGFKPVPFHYVQGGWLVT